MRNTVCNCVIGMCCLLANMLTHADDHVAPASDAVITLPQTINLTPSVAVPEAIPVGESAPPLPVVSASSPSALESALSESAAGGKPVAKLGPPTPVWPDNAAEYDPLWDWIQVNTREWLKGKIKSMEHGRIVFDSDKAGILNLKWEDIRVLRSARPMAVFYNENSLILGRLTTEGNNLVVHGATGDFRIAMDNVVSMAAGSPEEIDYWSANISFGMNVRSGNTDQTDFNSTAEIQRRTARTNAKFGYRGNYSSTNEVLDSNDHRANLSYDILFSRYWYARPLSVEYYRDPFQNVDSQWTFGLAIGYFIMDSAKQRWSINAGPGYQITRFVEVLQGSSLKENTPAFILGTNYVQEVTPDVDFTATYNVTYTSRDAGRVERNATAGLDVDLTKRFDLTLGLTWDHVAEPQADAQGVVPDQDDLRMTVGLKYEL
jgi:putative salt-induced outer membrane protein YdiY